LQPRGAAQTDTAALITHLLYYGLSGATPAKVGRGALDNVFYVLVL
jgi:hypothetical protein